MKNVLFIYGYGGSPQSRFCTLIREALPKGEYNVLCPQYPQEDCNRANDFLLKYIDENNIDLVIGTSLGGFIALILDTRVPTIVLNPCMVPSVELPKLEPRPDHPDDVRPSAEMIATYKPFEPSAFNKEAIKRRLIVGMFAENDELLGMKYKDAFIDCYDRVRYMPGGHHGNKEAIPSIVSVIEGVFAPYEVVDWFSFMTSLRNMSLDDFFDEHDPKWLWIWKEMQVVADGDVVIRLIEGGNRVMRVGDSKPGYTPGFVVGAPVIIKSPVGGFYQGGFIRSIDWENKTFTTIQSTYSFHFVRRHSIDYS